MSANERTHTVTLGDLQTLKRADDMELAPNGTELAFTVGGEIWQVSTRPGSKPRDVARGEHPQYSPDGKWLSFYRKESSKAQLWVLNLKTRHAESVTNLEDGIDPNPFVKIGSPWPVLRTSWSPDGTRIAFTSRRPIEASQPGPVTGAMDPASDAGVGGSPLVLDGTTPQRWALWGIFNHFDIRDTDVKTWRELQARPKVVDQIFVVTVATHELRQLTTDPAGCFEPSWSNDGLRIFCASTQGNVMWIWAQVDSNIFAVDARTGEKTALTEGAGSKHWPSMSPDGHTIAYLASDTLFRNHIGLVPEAGGPARILQSTLNVSLDEAYWAPDGVSIITVRTDGVVNGSGPSIEAIHVAKDTVRQLSPSASNHIAVASRAGTLAWQESNPSHSGLIQVLGPGRVKPYSLLNLNPQVDSWILGQQEVVHWQTSAGEPHEGILIKPVGYRPGKKYPLIIDAYPGQRNDFRGAALSGNQAWAAMGYAIFFPSVSPPHTRVNPFMSQAIDDRARGPKGWDRAMDQLLSGVDAVVAMGIADPDKMCLYGHSNGGGVVNYAVTRTNRFKCAVSIAGALTDWTRIALLSYYPGMLSMFEGGDAVWDDPAGYVQLSAVYHLKAVTTPMLLADGDYDDDFLLDTIEMYNGLRYYGKDVTLLRYPDQGHVLQGAAMQDFWKRELAFFERHLKDR
ncbi:MAG: hypothetical protein JWN85_660 [Gammaproteobacteria bacterium]|nr:hypothetical protein [Gammaproteobacteria bacterium]